MGKKSSKTMVFKVSKLPLLEVTYNMKNMIKIINLLIKEIEVGFYQLYISTEVDRCRYEKCGGF